MQKNIILTVAVVLLLGGGYFFYAKKSTNTDTMNKMGDTVSVKDDAVIVEESSNMPAGEENSTVEEKVVMTDDQKSMLEMEMGSFYYKPNTLTAKVGEPITIKLNSVSMMHDFNIDELNVHSPMVKNGDSYELTFTPTKAGVFEFYCSVGQHRVNGQVGKITVN